LRICLIGKFPPIQGGVSMRTYWSAHALAARGHDVHVVTNAKEARPPFRMLMRREDWDRCSAVYGGGGTVTVHWTEPVDSSQSYIPMASPFITKLAGTAARVHAEHPFDVILSYYLEPYGVAGHLAAEIARVPHVVRMAGSDAGHLWQHPQLEALYDHVLRSAAVVIAGGPVAERARQRGVDPGRVADGGGFTVPDDLFCPDGPALDLAVLRADAEADPDFRDLLWGKLETDRPYFGVYGKLGESKGSFALLKAMHRLKQAGLDIGLVALAHGQPRIESSFRSRAQRLGLVDRILQIPFVPHWRVPEFLRGCLAVCCLEQDFPIVFHTPVMPREALLCGGCLVGSTEVIRKLRAYGRLVHGYGCVAIEDVNDIDLLSARLAEIVRDPAPAAAVGARGREFARAAQQNAQFPQTLERILETVVRRRPPRKKRLPEIDPIGTHDSRFKFTELAADAIRRGGTRGRDAHSAPARGHMDLARARDVLATVERAIGKGRLRLRPFAPAIRLEIAIADAESEADKARAGANADPLFRLRIERWAMLGSDLPRLVPICDRGFRILKFDDDVSQYRNACSLADFPATPLPGPSYVLAFGFCDSREQDPLLVDAQTVQILELSDGSRTALEIARRLHRQDRTSRPEDYLEWIERLFVSGLLGLQRAPADPETRVPAQMSAAGPRASQTTNRLPVRAAPARRKFT
jgi:glycosyltransferase involved in cell wall biosynthesis